jgi:hypothetical protein
MVFHRRGRAGFDDLLPRKEAIITGVKNRLAQEQRISLAACKLGLLAQLAGSKSKSVLA